MVPVSVRRAGQQRRAQQPGVGGLRRPAGRRCPTRWTGWPRSAARWTSTRRRCRRSTPARSSRMGDFVAPTLLSMGVRAALQAGQIWCQAVTTNVPGPRIPLYVLGRRMVSAHAYVPIAGGTRCSIGIFSYLNTMTFGINADFDGFPDVDVLSGGIRRGIDELLELARAEQATPEGEPAPARPAATAEAPAGVRAPAGEPRSGPTRPGTSPSPSPGRPARSAPGWCRCSRTTTGSPGSSASPAGPSTRPSAAGRRWSTGRATSATPTRCARRSAAPTSSSTWRS